MTKGIGLVRRESIDGPNEGVDEVLTQVYNRKDNRISF